MTTDPPLRVAYLTAGAAGMYCGSCMHDNTLARALSQLGVDIQLVPMYTPIQTDEVDVSLEQVFFGGINVYLQQRFRIFRRLPKLLDRVLDSPRLLRWIGSRGIETKAEELGELALSMLRGSAGFQRKEIDRLCAWLSREPRPQLINLTNVLVGGCVPELRAALQVPITVTLQGDDIFLGQLNEQDREQAIEEIGKFADQVDAFLVHSEYYGDFMSEFLRLPRTQFRQVPLGIDTDGYTERPEPAATAKAPDKQLPLQIGYLARLAPEKGLHVLVDAFVLLHEQWNEPVPLQLQIAGWLGKQHADYAACQFAKLDAAGLGAHYRYLGTVDRDEKLQMLSRLDLFSVPAVYQEPKGLYVLEALAAGAPVVLPRHGAFPELVDATGGGQLVTPDDPAALAQAWHQLLMDHGARQQLGKCGQRTVLETRNASAMAQETLDVFRQIVAEATER